MGRIGNRSELEAFARSVDLGSFSAAARELKLSPSGLSKLVTRLEDSLEVRLLSRTTRKLALTSEGALFLERCRRILTEMEVAESEVTRIRQRPRGKLRMHAGVGFATHLLVPALPAFIRRYPEVQVELLIEDEGVDLLKDGADLAVRAAAVSDPSLVARKISEVERVVCASPKYLALHGEPRTPEELSRHKCITLVFGALPYGSWSFTSSSGRQVLELDGLIKVNNADCAARLALAGLGIVRLNEFIVSDDIRKGNLVPILTEFHCSEPLPILALYPPMRQRLPRVSAMLQFLLEQFGNSPWRIARQQWRKQ